MALLTALVISGHVLVMPEDCSPGAFGEISVKPARDAGEVKTLSYLSQVQPASPARNH